MAKTVTCIICPKSCRITVGHDDQIKSRDICCSKGKKYAISEARDPRRIFTTTAAISNGDLKRAPLRSTRPIKKDDWNKAMDVVKCIKLEAPLMFHEKVFTDFLEKGIDLISTRQVLKKRSSLL